MTRPYVARYPHEATEAFFDEFLSGLEPSRRQKVVEAALSLEAHPKPAGNPEMGYVDTEGGPMEVLLRFLPGIPFVGGRGMFREDLQARHHITVAGVTVVYALNEVERIVWLMYIRNA